MRFRCATGTRYVSLSLCLLLGLLASCARNDNSDKGPTREAVDQWLAQTLPAKSVRDFDTTISLGTKTVFLVVVSAALDSQIHDYTPIKNDWQTRVFIFAAVPPHEVTEHQFLKPATDSLEPWVDIGCSQYHLARLSESTSSPVVVAQRCAEEGLTSWRYLVFDDSTIAHPVVGAALWEYEPDSAHPPEFLVPVIDTSLIMKTSTRFGDGKTVVEGLEGEVDGTGDTIRTRPYYLVWKSGHLQRENGEWTDYGE